MLSIRELAEEVIEEEEAKMRQKLAQEMAAQRLRVFTALCEDVVEDTVSELAAKLAGEEMTYAYFFMSLIKCNNVLSIKKFSRIIVCFVIIFLVLAKTYTQGGQGSRKVGNK